MPRSAVANRMICEIAQQRRMRKRRPSCIMKSPPPPTLQCGGCVFRCTTVVSDAFSSVELFVVERNLQLQQHRRRFVLRSCVRLSVRHRRCLPRHLPHRLPHARRNLPTKRLAAGGRGGLIYCAYLTRRCAELLARRSDLLFRDGGSCGAGECVNMHYLLNTVVE